MSTAHMVAPAGSMPVAVAAIVRLIQVYAVLFASSAVAQ